MVEWSDSQLGGAHAVPDADQRLGHLVALLVDQGRQVPRVVEPAGCMVLVVALSLCPRRLPDTHGHSP